MCFSSPDAVTIWIEITESESVPHFADVPCVAVATAPPMVTLGLKGSDGRVRPCSANARDRSPSRTPASTSTVFFDLSIR